MSKPKNTLHVALPNPIEEEDPSGNKKIERIYLNRIAAQIVQNSEDQIKPNNFKVPSDSQAYRLAFEFVGKYFHDNNLNLSLEISEKETNHRIRSDKHHPDHLSRCLNLNKFKPLLNQLLEPRLTTTQKIEENIKSRDIIENNKKMILSDDDDIFTEVLATQIPNEPPKKHISHKRHHHSRNKKQESETFTNLGNESNNNSPNIWDSSYALSENKLKRLEKKRRIHKNNSNLSENKSNYEYQSYQTPLFSYISESVQKSEEIPKKNYDQRTWAELEKSSISEIEVGRCKFNDLFNKLIQKPIKIEQKPINNENYILESNSKYQSLGIPENNSKISEQINSKKSEQNLSINSEPKSLSNKSEPLKTSLINNEPKKLLEPLKPESIISNPKSLESKKQILIHKEEEEEEDIVDEEEEEEIKKGKINNNMEEEDVQEEEEEDVQE